MIYSSRVQNNEKLLPSLVIRVCYGHSDRML